MMLLCSFVVFIALKVKPVRDLFVSNVVENNLQIIVTDTDLHFSLQDFNLDLDEFNDDVESFGVFFKEYCASDDCDLDSVQTIFDKIINKECKGNNIALLEKTIAALYVLESVPLIRLGLQKLLTMTGDEDEAKLNSGKRLFVDAYTNASDEICRMFFEFPVLNDCYGEISVKVASSTCSTPLAAAINSRSIEHVREMLGKDCIRNTASESNHAFYFAACRRASEVEAIEIIDLLLNCKGVVENVSTVELFGKLILVHVIECERVNIANKLLECEEIREGAREDIVSLFARTRSNGSYNTFFTYFHISNLNLFGEEFLNTANEARNEFLNQLDISNPSSLKDFSQSIVWTLATSERSSDYFSNNDSQYRAFLNKFVFTESLKNYRMFFACFDAAQTRIEREVVFNPVFLLPREIWRYIFELTYAQEHHVTTSLPAYLITQPAVAQKIDNNAENDDGVIALNNFNDMVSKCNYFKTNS